MAETETPYQAPPDPEPGSPGAEPGVTPSPSADSAAADTAPADASDMSALAGDGSKQLRVEVGPGQSLPGYGVLRAGQLLYVDDSPSVRGRIESGFLRLVDDADPS